VSENDTMAPCRSGADPLVRPPVAAAIANKSINEYMNEVLDKATREVVEG
jgi:hypothetical protein